MSKKLTDEQQFYIDKQLEFTEELNNQSDDQIQKFHVEQKKNRDDILTEIAKVILSYNVVKEVMNIKGLEKKNLETKLVNMVNEKVQSELNTETKLTGELLKSIGKDRYSVNDYIYSLGAEDKKEPNNELKVKSSKHKIPNQMASRTNEEKNIITNITRVDNIEANTLDDIINRKVDEKLWSDRLWANKNETAKDLRAEIKDFLNGKTNINEIENKIKKKYNTNGNETKRLVQDNVAKVQEGINDVWREEHDIKHVLYMATLCGNTCADCRQYDGKDYPVDKKPVELPQHCFCRCTYVNIPAADWRPKMRLDNETKKNINWQSYEEWMKSKKQTGGKYTRGDIAWNDRRDDDGKEYYDSIRKMKTDVSTIAKNTGFSEKMINQIKNHVFFNDKHILYGGVGLLAPDYDMSVAWQRLINGKFEKRDILLLRHEYLESGLEKRYNLTNKQAHDITTKKYDWWGKLVSEKGDLGEDDCLTKIIKEK